MIALFERREEPPLEGSTTCARRRELAARGGALGRRTLRAVADDDRAAACGRAPRSRRRCSVALAARDRAGARAASPSEIDRAVEPDGSDLRDTASPSCAGCASSCATTRQRAAEELRRLARSPALREHLQEDFVAQRGGRPVFAVKASARRSVPGIVHDVSDSGQTLFVEPLELVELNNRQSEAASAEREEVARILRELSAVGRRARGRRGRARRGDGGDRPRGCARRRLARLARRAGRDRATRCGCSRHGIRCSIAKTAVPIDLDLGALRALVISGPNTGGKTVALKTLGLAALLHQAGFRPPAERRRCRSSTTCSPTSATASRSR